MTLSSVTTPEGYRTWAETYDQPGNQLVDLEQPVVREILQHLPVGLALDVACGTGRHARYLAELGHRVIGVDSAQAMLDRAAANVPDASLSRADLHQLPVPDHAVDLVVCALALTHVPDLGAALTEFVRVLRPGGHLVISDSRGLFGYFGAPVPVRTSDGWPGGHHLALPSRAVTAAATDNQSPTARPDTERLDCPMTSWTPGSRTRRSPIVTVARHAATRPWRCRAGARCRAASTLTTCQRSP